MSRRAWFAVFVFGVVAYMAIGFLVYGVWLLLKEVGAL